MMFLEWKCVIECVTTTVKDRKPSKINGLTVQQPHSQRMKVAQNNRKRRGRMYPVGVCSRSGKPPTKSPYQPQKNKKPYEAERGKT